MRDTHIFKLSDLWIHYNAIGRSRSNSIAKMRPSPASRMPYPEGRCLAYAVIGQAAKDAQPEDCRGGQCKHITTAVLYRQYESLRWLCSADPDLEFWCALAGYSASCLRHRFQPLLSHFEAKHTGITAKYAPLPGMPSRTRTRPRLMASSMYA